LTDNLPVLTLNGFSVPTVQAGGVHDYRRRPDVLLINVCLLPATMTPAVYFLVTTRVARRVG